MHASIVDLSPIPADGTATDAYALTTERARRAESLGYTRFWVAEHHAFTERLAGTTPEVLISHLAANTESIRLGSGAVLLNHYSPYKVAETFGVLDALAPDRIDCGLGRATGDPVGDHALQVDRSERPKPGDHEGKIHEVAAHLYDGFDADHPFSGLDVVRSGASIPDVWVLGSSPSSAGLAGRLGLPYAFAAFIRPEPAVHAFETYREHFEPSPFGAGPPEPRGLLAVNVTCAETDAEAARLRAPTEVTFRRLRRGQLDRPPIRTVEAAIDELGGVPEPTPATLEPGAWPRAISGSPETCVDLLDQLTTQAGVEEVMVQTSHPDPEDTRRSDELLAEALDLPGR